MDKKDIESVHVIGTVQKVLDLLEEHSLKVKNRVEAQEAVNKVDERLDIARGRLREYVDSHLGELYIDMDGKIFKITAHPNDGDVIIEPVHINFRRITAKS